MTNGAQQGGLPKLALGERNALRKFCRTKRGFEAPSRWGRIGVASLRSLVDKGLAVEGPRSVYGPTFKLTEAGWMVLERLNNPRGSRPAKAGRDGWAQPPLRISVTIDMPASADHGQIALHPSLGALLPPARTPTVAQSRRDRNISEQDIADSFAAA